MTIAAPQSDSVRSAADLSRIPNSAPPILVRFQPRRLRRPRINWGAVAAYIVAPIVLWAGILAALRTIAVLAGVL